MFVLLVVTVGGIILVALGAFASASARSTEAYQSVRDRRYAGDGAIKTAINTVKNDPQLAVDPSYSDKPCVEEVVTKVGNVTVSCALPADSAGSGVPPHQGIVPPESLLLLGARHNEPGPYSSAGCEKLGKRASDWWAGYGGSSSDNAENSMTMRKIPMINPIDFWSDPWSVVPQCNTTRVRGDGPLTIKGGVVTSGRALTTSSFKLSITGAPGNVRARWGCSPASPAWWPNWGGMCTSFTDTTTRPTGTVGAGSLLRLDPGRKSAVPSVGEATDRVNISPLNDIADAFLPIGFDADGTLRSGYDLPVRTTAYVYDKSANTSGSVAANGTVDVPKYLKPVPSNNCADPNVGAGTPIIFLPGWYKSADFLNSYTANSSCVDRTLWFAPNAGGDLELLTDDDETGAFYMDLREGTGSGCGTMTTAIKSRWCLGGAGQTGQNSNSKPRVVVGTPKGWTPFPASTTQDPSDPPAADSVNVVLDTARAIDTNWLSIWTNIGNASKIEAPATPSLALFEPCPWFCWSLGERSLRLADFAPKTTAGPVAEPIVSGDTVAAPTGRVYIDFAYKLQLGTYPHYYQPAIEIDTLDDEGVTKACGAFDISKDAAYSAAVTTWTTTAAQARGLAEQCGSVDMINNMRVHFKLKGTTFWSFLNPGYPKVEIDGARIRFKSYSGASFPVGTDGEYQSTQPAKGDCDDTAPGAQLIFGGESHVYAADGSLEVCGGPDPDDPANRMVTGIYGVPAVEPIAPSAATRSNDSGDGEQDFYSFDGLTDAQAAARLRIGEPSGRQDVPIRYNDSLGMNEGRVQVTFPALSIPSNYRVGYIDARVSYDSNNPAPGLSWGTNAEYWKEGNRGNCRRYLPLTKTMAQVASIKEGNDFTNRMFTAGGASNCMNVASSTANPLTSGLALTYAARGNGLCFDECGGDHTFKDYLDGIELEVGLLPAAGITEPLLLPQSGCIVAHPNYFAGEGTPDCAVVKADAFRAAADSPREDTQLRGNWIGRVSVKGAIYAPSSALEYDDNDVGYPLASRGIIARHLLVTGAKARANYTDPMVGGTLKNVPSAREAVFTACIKDSADPDPDLPCGDGSSDRILTQAKVHFEPAVSGPADNQIVNWVPVAEWWTDRVTG